MAEAQDDRPSAIHPVPQAPTLKGTAPEVSRPSLLDGLASSLPFSLDESGGFKTSVDLRVPDFRGLQPQLKIAYDSGGANGMLGVGWSLSAPSVIQRYDAHRGVPAYGDTDQYSLDGEELIPCGRQRAPGRPGGPASVQTPACEHPVPNQPSYRYYFTRRASHRRIAFDAGSGTWRVWTADGVELDYGLAWLTGAHRLPNRWLLTRVQDVSGNVVDYSYQSCSATPDPGLFASSVVKAALQRPVAASRSSAEAKQAHVNIPVAGPPGQPAALARRLYELRSTVVAVRSAGLFAPFGGAQPEPAPSRAEKAAHPTPSRFERESLLSAAGRLSRRAAGPEGGGRGRPDGETAPSSARKPPVEPAEGGIEGFWKEQAWVDPAIPARELSTPAPEDRPWLNRADRLTGRGKDDWSVEYVYLKRIAYGRTAVDFYLEGRPDPMTFGIGDETMAHLSCRLAAVDVQGADAAGAPARVRSYQFRYQQRNDSLRSSLVHVREYGSDAQLDASGKVVNVKTATAMPPILFSPANPAGVQIFHASSGQSAPGPRPQTAAFFQSTPQSAPVAFSPGNPRPALSPIILDLNGDGLKDIVFAYYRNRAANDLEVILQPFLGTPQGRYQALNWVDTGLGRTLNPGESAFITSQVGNVDGDGREDIVWGFNFGDPADPLPYVHMNLAVTRFDPVLGLTTSAPQSIDWPVAGFVLTPANPGQAAAWKDPARFFVTDVDGDGLDDVLLLSDVAGLPDNAACAADRAACLDPVMSDRRWRLVPILSRGDGTFERKEPIDTGWEIHPALDHLVDTSSGSTMDADFFAGASGVESALQLFRPGTEDRFLLADVDGDGRNDLIRLSNEGPPGAESLEICGAWPRTSLTDDPKPDRFDIRCDYPALPPLDNRQIYVAGDLDGDHRADLTRIFTWYPGGRPKTEVRQRTDCPSDSCPTYSFLQIDNALTAFQPIVSSGRSFTPGAATRTTTTWPRNYVFAVDWQKEYWNAYNYSLSDWACLDANDDQRCDLALLRYPFEKRFLNIDEWFGPFLTRSVDGYATQRVIELSLAVTTPNAAGVIGFQAQTEVDVARHGSDDGLAGSLALVDVNGDGRFDVSSWHWTGTSLAGDVRTYEWNVETWFRRGPQTRGAPTLVTDINGDGLADLVRVESWNDGLTIEVGERNASGSLTRLPLWRASGWTDIDGRAARALSGDVDGDGRDDIILPRVVGGALEIHTFRSNGDGTFREWISRPPLAPPELFDDLSGWRVGDVDGDGRADLIHLTRVAGLLRVDTLRSDGAGSFEPATKVLSLPDIPGASASFGTGDANADGRTDLIGAWSHPDGRVSAYALLADPAGWKPVHSEFRNLGVLVAPFAWAGIDTNADRLTDLQALVSSERLGNFDLWTVRLRGRGDGTFEAARTRVERRFPTSDLLAWTPVDLNGDGKTDLVRIQAGGASLRLNAMVTSPGDQPWLISWTVAAPGTPSIVASQMRPVETGASTATLEAVSLSSTTSDQTWNINSIQPMFAPDRMEQFRDGLGGRAGISYATTAGRTDNVGGCGLPAGLSLQMVASVGRLDGRSAAPDVTSYDYHCPRWSWRERRALGFATWTSSRPASVNRPQVSTVSEVLLDDSCGARSRSTLVKGLGQEYTHEVLSYVPEGAAAPFKCLVASRSETASDIAGSTATKQTDYAYGPWLTVETTTDHGDLGVTGDERRTEERYSLLADRFRVVLDSKAVYGTSPDPAWNERFCYDDHPLASATGTCAHAPSDAGLQTLDAVWDDHEAAWFTRSTEYDSLGDVIRTVDQRGAESLTEWDAVQHLMPVKTTDALGHVETATWDPVHVGVISRIDANGATPTTTVYDALGRISLVTVSDGGWTRFSYEHWGDPQRQAVRKTVWDGVRQNWSVSHFDGLGRVWREERLNGAGNGSYVREWSYSDTSPSPYQFRPWRDASAAAVVETFQYDYEGRAITVAHPDGTASRAEYHPRSTILTDEMSGRRETRFDAYDQVVALVEHPAPGPALVSSLAFDPVGRLIGQTDAAGNRWIYHLGSAGRAWKTEDPDRGQRSYTYDAGGNVLTQTDAMGVTISFTYDGLGRMTARTSPGRKVAWIYDDPGTAHSIERLAYITDDASGCPVARRYQFDARGREIADAICIDGVTQTMSFAYDGLGRRSTVIYPDGESIDTRFDYAGRMMAIGALATLSFDPRDRLVGQLSANGVQELRSYDQERGWLTDQQIILPANAQPGFGVRYVRRADGYPTSIQDTLATSGGTTEEIDSTYTYDAQRRLLSVQASSPEQGARPWSETFTYDVIGNLLSRSSLGAYAYGADASACAATIACGGGPHAARTAGQFGFSYDANGDMNRESGPGGVTLYGYDEEDRLKSVTGPATSLQFGYDALGRRTKRTVAGSAGSSTVLYFGRWLEVTSAGLAKLYYAGDRLIARRDAAGLHFIHADELGSVRLVTDSHGVVEGGPIEYAPFGSIMLGDTSASAGRTFDGGIQDRSSEPAAVGDLNFLGSRYYDPVVARFMTADNAAPPLANPQAWNPYAFALNAPTAATDPTGHQAIEPDIATSPPHPAPFVSLSWGTKQISLTWDFVGERLNLEVGKTLNYINWRPELEVGVKFPWVRTPRFITFLINDGQANNVLSGPSFGTGAFDLGPVKVSGSVNPDRKGGSIDISRTVKTFGTPEMEVPLPYEDDKAWNYLKKAPKPGASWAWSWHYELSRFFYVPLDMNDPAVSLNSWTYDTDWAIQERYRQKAWPMDWWGHVNPAYNPQCDPTDCPRSPVQSIGPYSMPR